MRFIKMLGLAMIASVVAMAFLGAGSAMAVVDPEVVVCGENNLLCPTAKLLPKGAIILGTTTKAPVLLGALEEKCDTGHTEGTLTSPGGMGTSLLGTFNLISFTGNCKPCTTVSVTAKEMHITRNAGTETWLAKVLDALAQLSGCPFGISCHFFASEVHLTASNTAEGTLLEAKEAPIPVLSGQNFFCGSGGKWDAHYLIKGHWLSSYKL